MLLCPQAALGADPPPPFTSWPVIQGEAVVGSTLRVAATWTGELAPKFPKYTWHRCPASGGACPAITEATTERYVVTAADVGFRLRANIHLKNKVDPVANAPSVTTAVVVAAPSPTPSPGPSPPPSLPGPAPVAATPAPTPAPTPGTSFPEPVAPIVGAKARATLLRPFPVVRIRGYFTRGGVRVTLLSVKGPRSAHITVRCVGRGCPVRKLSRATAPARLRPFERFLRAGTVLQVRVTSAGSIGKYVSFLIRTRSAPLRSDLCLRTERAKPTACPAP